MPSGDVKLLRQLFLRRKMRASDEFGVKSCAKVDLSNRHRGNVFFHRWLMILIGITEAFLYASSEVDKYAAKETDHFLAEAIALLRFLYTENPRLGRGFNQGYAYRS